MTITILPAQSSVQIPDPESFSNMLSLYNSNKKSVPTSYKKKLIRRYAGTEISVKTLESLLRTYPFVLSRLKTRLMLA